MSFKPLVSALSFFMLNQLYRFKYFMVYRLQSAIWLIYSAFTNFYGLITLTIIYGVSSGIAGWSYFQILALSGTVTMVVNVLYTVVNPWAMVQDMREGRMDTHLIRPYGIITILLSSFGETTAMGGFVSGLAIFAFATIHTGFSMLPFAAYLAMAAAGTIALILFILMFALLSYHLFKSANFVNRIFGVISTAGSYPLKIFGSFLLLIFTVVLPIGVASYYPPEALYGKISMLPYAEVMIVILAVALASYKTSQALIKRYASGGG